MGVAKEYSGNHVGRVALNDLVEIIRPAWRGICSVPWSIVSKDIPLLSMGREALNSAAEVRAYDPSRTAPSRLSRIQIASCEYLQPVRTWPMM